MKFNSPKVYLAILSLAFFSLFLGSCGKEHDLISDYVIKAEPNISTFKSDTINTAITQESTIAFEKKNTAKSLSN